MWSHSEELPRKMWSRGGDVSYSVTEKHSAGNQYKHKVAR